MTPFFVAIILPGLSSLAAAATFFRVYEWNDLDFKWPTEEIRTKSLQDGTFKPGNIDPRFMAVYGSRIFFVLEKHYGVPATLVSLPTSSASRTRTPPKITPFPSWDMHEFGNCNKIEEAKGVAVDSVGRLWVLDDGSEKCEANKLWIFDLNNNKTELFHRFSFYDWMHDLVLDETPNGTFAYITWWDENCIVVFSLERQESWIVETPGVQVFSIALSPKDQEPRRLYLGKYKSNELYSISVAALRNGTRTANPNPIANWTGVPNRMVVDNNGTIYAGFFNRNYIHSWNGYQPFQELRFFEVAKLNFFWPVTFALDQNGNLWIMAFNENEAETRFRLLKAALEAKRSWGPARCILIGVHLICSSNDPIVENYS